MDHSPSATGWNLSFVWPSVFISLLLPPSLTFLLSLWRSHNNRAALQKELNASQQHTLSLGERKDHIKIKKRKLEVFGKGCMDTRGLCRLSAQPSSVWQHHASSVGHAFMCFISPRPAWAYDRSGCKKQRCLRTSSVGFRRFSKKASRTQPCPWTCLVLLAVYLRQIKSLFLFP